MSSSPPSTTPTSKMKVGVPNLSSKSRKAIILVVAVICFGLIATIGALGHQSTLTFKACLGTLLCLLGCSQLFISVALFKNRKITSLELLQPIGLSLFALSGAVATFGAITLTLPENDIACALRQPIIFTCMSLMGSILVARAWRIGCLVTPSLSLASSEEAKVDKIQVARTRILRTLSKLSGRALCMGSCGRYRVASETSTRKSLRKQVTLTDSIRVAAVLVLPQVLLQVINVSVPSVKMQSVEVYDDLYICQSSTGPLFLILGIILAVAPFIVTLLLNAKSEGMPDVFRDFDQLLTCGKSCVGVLIITLPTVGMVANIIPNAHAYLLVASLLSFILPLCYHIAWSRLHALKKDKGRNGGDNVMRRSSSLGGSPGGRSSAIGRARIDDLETLQMAEDATIAGKMFETMGNLSKAITVNDEILSMFKKHGDYAYDVGFTLSEIHSFGPNTLKMVVSTLISNGQRRASQLSSPSLSSEEEVSDILQKLFKSGLDALSIFERAPAKDLLQERRFLYPVYSMMSLLLNSGDADITNLPDNQSPAELENNCASSFVETTKYQVAHYCRALAMKAVPLVKMQKFDDAFAVVNEMNAIYDPKLHTAAIVDAYGTDHSATILAVSALWHQHLNQTEKALSICADVIERILPHVGRTNVNNSNMLGLNQVLFPIIRVLIAQDQEGVGRAYELYNSHVVEPFNSSGKGTYWESVFIRPIKILLTCKSIGTPVKYDGMENDIEWMLNGEPKVVDKFDTNMTFRFSLSIYSLLAEVCLHLAKRHGSGSGKKCALIEEGLKYSGLAEPKVKDNDGNVTNHIAHDIHTRVYSELCTERDMSEHTIKEMCSSSISRRDSIGSAPNEIVEDQPQHDIENIPV